MRETTRTTDIELQAFLDAYAKAFTSGDGEAVAAMWSVPALVVHAEGTRAVSTKAEVAEFFGGAKGQYDAMGVVGTRAEIQQVETAGDRIIIVAVRWPYLDKRGREVNAESSTYTLLLDGEGKPSVVCVALHGVERQPTQSEPTPISA